MNIRRIIEPPPPQSIIIVGGGAAATIAVAQIFRRGLAAAPLDVHVVEKRPAFGPGLAYRTEHHRHTVNNFAERLSAIDGDPGHLIRWCAARGLDLGARSFPSRRVYGEYLQAVLDDVVVPGGSALRRTRAEAVDLEAVDGAWHVRLRDGETLIADRVVLALGNPPPRPQPHLERLGQRYVADPWTPDLLERIGGARRLLLLGTGLTMADIAVQMHESVPQAQIVAASRHGELPLAHVAEPTDGADWRDVVDAVRGVANQLWSTLEPEDQARFAARYARQWDTRRHRLSPTMAHHLDKMIDSGALVVRTLDQVDPAEFDVVVNCTGFRSVASHGWNPLMDAMLTRGLARPHPLGTGVDLVAPGHPVDSDGQPIEGLFWLGAGRKGLEWEVTAVPDLREQAVALARTVRRRPTVRVPA